MSNTTHTVPFSYEAYVTHAIINRVLNDTPRITKVQALGALQRTLEFHGQTTEGVRLPDVHAMIDSAVAEVDKWPL